MVTVMACAECEILRERLAAAQAKLGDCEKVGAVAAICGHLGLQPAQSRILLRLYRAGNRFMPVDLLIDEMRNPDAMPETIKTQVCRIRAKVGKDKVETGPGGRCYRLTPEGLERVCSALAAGA